MTKIESRIIKSHEDLKSICVDKISLHPAVLTKFMARAIGAIWLSLELYVKVGRDLYRSNLQQAFAKDFEDET